MGLVRMRRCTKCGEEKPEEAFQSKGKARPGQYATRCKVCIAVYLRGWQQKNKARRQAASRHKLYGVEPEAFASLEAAQGGGCAICGQRPTDRALCVDHDHDTGQVRGLLCKNCNYGLGCFGDTSGRLLLAMRYLERYGK